MSDTRAALEAALAADPDDAALHAAYADLLIEAGDPRGEYVRLQLALEDHDQPVDRLRELEQRAFELRRAHEAEWLGPLDPFVNPPRGPSVGAMVADNVSVTWRRGWVAGLQIQVLSRELAAAAAASPATRLLRDLAVVQTADPEPRPVPRPVTYLPLVAAGRAAALRSLTLGDETDLQFLHGRYDVPDLVACAPRLEVLRLWVNGVHLGRLFQIWMPHLRVFHLATADPPRLDPLWANDSLGRLAELHLEFFPARPDPDAGNPPPRADWGRHPHLRALLRSPHLTSLERLALRLPGFGDAGVDELIASGLIDRLRGLDLVRCEITDDGAEALARCPAIGKLDYLHLGWNYLSPIGIDALARAGVDVSEYQLFGPGYEMTNDE